MDRRQFLRLGTVACASTLAHPGCDRRESSAPQPAPPPAPDPVRELTIALHDSLDEATRRACCVGYDHPLRQYHNRGVEAGGVLMRGSHFTSEQLELLQRLFLAGLSEAGREIIPQQTFLRFGGIWSLRLLIAGDPRREHYQVIMSGPHLNLRLGGKNREGVAFGGPQIYGDQQGNERQGLPGNKYREQFLLGDRLFHSLGANAQRQALLERAPIQTQIELQGRSGRFPGVALRDCGDASQRLATELIDHIFKAYPPADVAYAWQCLRENGGVGALHASFYRDGEVDGSGQYQTFRLEGPAAVFYFLGAPHVHAFVNVAMDGERPLSVGPVVGENRSWLRGPGVKRFFEAVLREHCGTELSYYELEGAVGVLRPGVIREGDIYNLESWQNGVAVVTATGAQLTGRWATEQRKRGAALAAERDYRIATTSYLAGEQLAEVFGQGAVEKRDTSLRDAAIAFARKHGFAV